MGVIDAAERAVPELTDEREPAPPGRGRRRGRPIAGAMGTRQFDVLVVRHMRQGKDTTKLAAATGFQGRDTSDGSAASNVERTSGRVS
jgi:hypothetical protein